MYFDKEYYFQLRKGIYTERNKTKVYLILENGRYLTKLIRKHI